MNKINLNFQIVSLKRKNIPNKSEITNWLKKILSKKTKNIEITIRLVDKSEIHNLNYVYRKKNKPTNILSFSYNLKLTKKKFFLGDLIICTELIEEESIKFKKPLKFYWAHIIIHGTLHLLGFNHIKKQDKIKMENLEKKILFSLNF